MGKPIRLASAARYTVHPPASHQLAAWNWLEDQLTDAQLRQFAEMYRAAPAAKEPPPSALPLLKVPYFSQIDNASGQGWRECFSSSCAMIAAFYGKVRSDDEYNVIRGRYGDTTDSNAQVRALQSLGLKPEFRSNGTVALLESELRAGRPVTTGWLHKGSSAAPAGGGHWSVVIGFTTTHWIHNDPFGEADIVNGGYVNHSKGLGIAYSRRNWTPRWMVEGSSSGWCLLVKP